VREEIWQERLAALRGCVEAGMNRKQAAEHLGISQGTITNYCRAFDIDFGECRGRPQVDVEQYRGLITGYVEAGLCLKEAAAASGVSVARLTGYAKRLGLKFKSAWPQADMQRATAMAAMFRSGRTLQQIGELYGVSRERVRQIISKEFSMSGADGGQRKRADARRARSEAKKQAACLAKHGCTVEELAGLRRKTKALVRKGESYYRTPIGAFQNQRSNAKARGIGWNLTIWEWWNIWQESGHWEERGRSRDAFVMCRFGDTGAYEAGNVYIATLGHNSSLQPANPYRHGHPDFERTMAERRKAARRQVASAPRKPKNPGLPLGVTFHRNRYIAQICDAGQNRYLGSFKCPTVAHQAYLAAARAAEGRASA